MKQLACMIAVALSLMMGSTAIARGGDDRHFDRDHSYRHDHDGHRDFERRGRGFYDDRRFFDGRRYDGRGFNDRRFYDRRFNGRKFDDRRFYRDRYSYRAWRRGDRLPAVFLNTRFVINDYRSFGLYGPPRGYRWVRVERDAFLTGIATGVIIGIAADHFY